MASSLTQALLAIQEKVPAFQRNAINPYHGSRYVTLDLLLKELLPLLQEHQILFQTFPCFGPHGESALRYSFTHVPTGEVLGETMPLMLDKGTPQGQGSAITYARRYALVAVLNLVIDQDDDGNAAQATAALPPRGSTQEPLAAPTEDQQVVLRQLVADLTVELKKTPAEWEKVEAWAKERQIDLTTPPTDKLRAVERALRRKLETIQGAKK